MKMGKGKINIEKLYRSRFEGYAVEPSHTVWGGIQQKMFWKKFLSLHLNSFNMYYLAVGLAIPVTAAILLTRQPAVETGSAGATGQVQQSTGEPAAVIDSGILIKTFDEDATYQNLGNTGGKKSGQPSDTKKKKTTPVKKSALLQKQEPVDQETPGHETKTQKTAAEKKTEVLKSTVAFTASSLSGCAPLAVSFINESEHAASSYWTFGDGGSSSEKDPSYIYDEAGQYNVKLQIQGDDGVTRTESVDINVFSSPKAAFEFDEQVDINSGQPVYFYNYSKNADFYRWNFGDGNKSNLSDPIHYYETAGSYDITLRVWTANQCYDSLTVSNAFGEEGNAIEFPNAFSPNQGGPTGGYYDGNSPDNEVFHPMVEGELEEYSLKVYTQTGRLLFESNEVNLGWDGYYQGKLMGQDVYIWKARGKFTNGKTFIRSGDITLIRQQR